MRTYTILVVCIIFILNNMPNQNESIPVKYTSGCEIDLDKNGESDIALIIQSSYGSELIVLMRFSNSYKAYILFKEFDNMLLTCNYGYKLIGSSSNKLTPKEHVTNGTYLLLSQPESSKLAFYWDSGEFKKVWLSD